MFVVYCVTQLRDGREESAKVVPTKEEALALINKWAGGGCGDQKDLRLFRLGKEIPLEPADIVEPQPAKVTKGYKLKE